MIEGYNYAITPALRALTSPSLSCNPGYVMHRESTVYGLPFGYSPYVLEYPLGDVR
jgi:hypothetical protein